MELALNLAWALLSIAIVGYWQRFGPQTGMRRWTQIVALAVLILVLFPVISVTDDLQPTQNPAEESCCQRRNYAILDAHSIFPAATALPVPVPFELSFGFLHFIAPGSLSAPVQDHPGLAAIQNRPPPAA